MIMRPIDDKKSIYFKAYLLSIKEIKKSIMFHVSVKIKDTDERLSFCI